MSEDSEWPDPPDLADYKAGVIYEDCAYHPCLCINVSIEADEIWGVSLVDGSYPRSCSLWHCGVWKMTLADAWWAKRLAHRKRGDDALLRKLHKFEIGPRAERDGSAPGIAPSDLYADEVGHPCLCMGLNLEGGTVWGISLIDGTAPRHSSLAAVRGRRLDAVAAWERKRTIQRLPPKAFI